MKNIFYRNFEIVSNQGYEKVHEVLNENILTRHKFFPDKIMSGKLKAYQFNVVVNPPLFWLDPFGAMVFGELVEDNGNIYVKVKTTPNVFMFLAAGFFVLVGLYSLFQSTRMPKMELIDGGFMILYTILLALFILVPKLWWDTYRLKKWMNANLK